MSIQQVSASRIGNRNFLVTAGAQIPCVLQTAMDSTQPGLTSCVIPNDIWSANGKVILMEKGTRVLGEYSGGFSQGEHRRSEARGVGKECVSTCRCRGWP